MGIFSRIIVQIIAADLSLIRQEAKTRRFQASDVQSHESRLFGMCCLIYCSTNLGTILKVYLPYCIRFSRPIEQTFIFALHKLAYLLPLFNLRYK